MTTQNINDVPKRRGLSVCCCEATAKLWLCASVKRRFQIHTFENSVSDKPNSFKLSPNPDGCHLAFSRATSTSSNTCVREIIEAFCACAVLYFSVHVQSARVKRGMKEGESACLFF